MTGQTSTDRVFPGVETGSAPKKGRVSRRWGNHLQDAVRVVRPNHSAQPWPNDATREGSAPNPLEVSDPNPNWSGVGPGRSHPDRELVRDRK